MIVKYLKKNSNNLEWTDRQWSWGIRGGTGQSGPSAGLARMTGTRGSTHWISCSIQFSVNQKLNLRFCSYGLNKHFMWLYINSPTKISLTIATWLLLSLTTTWWNCFTITIRDASFKNKFICINFDIEFCLTANYLSIFWKIAKKHTSSLSPEVLFLLSVENKMS